METQKFKLYERRPGRTDPGKNKVAESHHPNPQRTDGPTEGVNMPAFGIKLERASCTHADKEGVGGVAEQGDHGALAALPNTEGDRHTSGSEWHTSGFQTTPPTCLGPPGFQRFGRHLHAARANACDTKNTGPQLPEHNPRGKTALRGVEYGTNLKEGHGIEMNCDKEEDSERQNSRSRLPFTTMAATTSSRCPQRSS